MTTGTRGSYQRAIDKATALRTFARVQQQGPGYYLVPASAEGIFYTVRVDSRANFTCTCPAGQAEKVCYHAAAVWIARLRDSSAGGPLLAPATTAPSARPSDAEIRAAILAESRTRTQTVGELEDLPTLAECFTTAAAA
jgi:uncharacterized Zn finger protein